MLTSFKAFRSTISPPQIRPMTPADKMLVDPVTGAPIGIQNQNDNGPDARFIPVDISQAQVNAPTPAMIADLDATFRLNVAPYTRYQSDGAQIIALGGGSENETLIMAGMTYMLASPLTVSTPNELIVEGGIKVLNLP